MLCAMSSNSTSKCLLCFQQIMVKTFEHHCEHRYGSVGYEHRYRRQYKKLIENINKNFWNQI